MIIDLNIPFFFIIGRARSGTTLLRTMFDAHPNVIIPLESPIIMHLYRKYGKVKRWDSETLNSFYEDTLKVKDFCKWEIDNESLRNSILDQPEDITYKELINLIYLSTVSFFPKSEIQLIGDKNPVYSISIKSIILRYPEAKYIHLQRDYRAHILSMLNAGLYAKDVIALAYRWKYSAKIISKIKNKFPEKFYSVRYEDLVNDPERYLKEMCDFLGIVFYPDMINYHTKLDEVYSEIKDKIEDHHKRVFQPIDVSRIDSWKQELQKDQILFADAVVGKWAEKEGYERIHKKPHLLTELKVFPSVTYQRIFYLYRYFHSKIPGFLRKLND